MVFDEDAYAEWDEDADEDEAHAEEDLDDADLEELPELEESDDEDLLLDDFLDGRELLRASEPRWAWGEEPLTQRELALGPRVAPATRLAARLTALLLACWLATLIVASAVALAPLALGRCALHLARIPLDLSHDPLALALGWAAALFSVSQLNID